MMRKQSEIDKAPNDIETNKNEEISLKSENQRLANQIQMMNQQVNTLKQENQTLMQQNEMLQGQLNGLKSENQAEMKFYEKWKDVQAELSEYKKKNIRTARGAKKNG
ncbi:hypothetical protein [Listeria fleischmannii]|uniref:Uncharacterized protein n=1 Tax=Listeria fleischmannii FSL S10-1203 TaxID=1265822 RepID=W7DR99_9LIST|nr:hypothetical protein [Listeria fleischmannii]EUJ52627.1 hypothetical protein MCOL2_12822 [Listeria fleischmannii FSL S10-1203]